MPDKLNELLGQRRTLSELPIIGPVSAEALRAYIAGSTPPCPDVDQVGTMLTKLSLAMPKAQTSEIEAKERLDIYWQVLRNYALPDLQQAFTVLLRTCRFFPTIAEIEEAVAPIRGRRVARVNRASLLVMKHEQEWRPPQPLLTAEEAARLGRILASPLAGDSEQQ